MSDIDFDELDRAVNGALGVPETPVSAPQPSVQSAPVVETPAVLAPESTAPVPVSAPVSKAPAARRSSGRFMDMVHPSSDMRTRTGNPSVSQPSTVQQRPAVQHTVEPMDEPEDDTPAWNEPLESPFLPDAKVDKRPLGGIDAAVTEPEALGVSFDFKGLLDDDEPAEILLSAPQPQERIEATTMPDPIDFAAAQSVTADIEAKTYEEPVEEKEEVLEPEVIVEVPEDTTPQPVLDIPAGPTSITPQYKEQPSSVEATGAMFDTESYHQPVTAPAKKKSGWFTVVLILILAIIGAGGGWAVSTYVLPML